MIAGCRGAPQPSAPEVRAQIDAALERNIEATRSKDIDAFMAGIPEDLVLRGDSGRVLTRSDIRASVLRDWSIIPRTLSISDTIDVFELHGDSAIVFTSQRWVRLMLERDGKTVDTVLTTQRHRETWRRTPKGWFPYAIQELGGDVFVNGKRYKR